MNNGIDSSDDYNKRDCNTKSDYPDSITVYINEFFRREREYSETLNNLYLIKNKLVGPIIMPEKSNEAPSMSAQTFPIIGLEISMMEAFRGLNERLINLNNALNEITDELTRII